MVPSSTSSLSVRARDVTNKHGRAQAWVDKRRLSGRDSGIMMAITLTGWSSHFLREPPSSLCALTRGYAVIPECTWVHACRLAGTYETTERGMSECVLITHWDAVCSTRTRWESLALCLYWDDGSCQHNSNERRSRREKRAGMSDS